MSFLQDRLGTTIEPAQENTSPVMPLALSKRIESRLRHKHADDFVLWDGIIGDGVFAPRPAKFKPHTGRLP